MGGPIKQGIMHGIREPKKNGGPTGTGLVGDQRYPKTDGREHHGIFLAPAAWTAARAAATRMAPRAINWAKNIFGKTRPVTKTVPKQGPTYFPPTGRSLSSKGYPGGRITGTPRGPGSAEVTKQEFTPYKFWANDPLYKAAVGSKGIAGKAIRGGGRLIKGAVTTPTGLIATGITTKMLWPDGTKKTPTELIEDNVIRKGDKDYGPYKKGKPTITQEMRDAKAKADKEKRINALLDTMGYDKARKNAAYDALIDAGRMVSERGTLDTKNIGRELIDPIVASASQRFDKPEQIREAVGLMQVKADIAKQMEDPQDKELRRLQIRNQEKALAGATLEETAEAIYTRHNQWPTGEALAYLARNKNIPIVDVVDTGNDEVGDPVAYMEGQIAQAVQDGVATPPGNYVIGKDIIIVDSEGNVSRR